MRKITEKELAQLSERKTVHEWLDLKGIPREEFGKQICLLRRLSIALEINTPNNSVQADLGSKAHFGDPCIYCGVAYNDVAVGDCPSR